MRLPSQVELDRDEVGRGGLYAFLRLAWHCFEPKRRFIGGKHLELICAHLEAAARGEMQGRTLVINIPPGMGKSTLVCVAFPAWVWATIDASKKFMFGSYSIRLARDHSRLTRDLVNSDWYRARWDARVDESATDSVEDFSTTAGGRRFTMTMKGQVTGWHPDFKIADDPNAVKDAQGTKGVTLKALQEVEEAWAGGWGTRGDPDQVTSIIIQQRIHQGDLTGVVTEDPETILLRLPMECELEELCETPWGKDWRTEEGELLCPERRSAAAVVKLKKRLRTPAAIAAQLQQRPQAKSGGTFQREWFCQIVDSLPDRPLVWIQAWDCNFGDADDPEKRDPVVGTTLACDGPNIYIVDVDWARSTFDETLVRMAANRRKWPKVVRVVVERRANGAACVATMKRKIAGFIAVENGNKATRAHSASAVWQSKNGYLLRASWNQPFIDEHVGWPKLKLDDRVDSACHGVCELVQYDMSRYAAFVDALTA